MLPSTLPVDANQETSEDSQHDLQEASRNDGAMSEVQDNEVQDNDNGPASQEDKALFQSDGQSLSHRLSNNRDCLALEQSGTDEENLQDGGSEQPQLASLDFQPPVI